MITARQSDIGRSVVYRAPYPDAQPEEGVITSVSGEYIFVRYGSDRHSKATYARELEWGAVADIVRAKAVQP